MEQNSHSTKASTLLWKTAENAFMQFSEKKHAQHIQCETKTWRADCLCLEGLKCAGPSTATRVFDKSNNSVESFDSRKTSKPDQDGGS